MSESDHGIGNVPGELDPLANAKSRCLLLERGQLGTGSGEEEPGLRERRGESSECFEEEVEAFLRDEPADCEDRVAIESPR